MRIWIFAAVAVCLLCIPSLALDQFAERESTTPSITPKKRLKVGVALEGGGALGLAHIGVLQWFEDHHIPVDYVAGTSMGGLVGGLYATGKSPADLKAIVNHQDWSGIIEGGTQYGDLLYRRKQDAQAFPNNIEFGLKHGVSLPSGLNSGQGVSLLIDRETLPYTHNGSFDDLPIPLRCVATDLVTGQAVVFDHGSIAQAMRATMSIPGVFDPVTIGKDVYVDGGLLGNLPTDVVRKMGADVVIAIHLEIAPVDAAHIQSLFSVLGRSVEVVIHQNEIQGLAGADLVVNVNLSAYTSMEYDKSADIVNQGLRAAAGKANILAPYELGDDDWNAYLSNRKSRTRTVVPVPEFVEVRGTRSRTSQTLEHFLQPLVGKPINVPDLEHVFNRLTGVGRFDSVDYWLTEKDGQTGLVVNVHEKSYAPPTVNLGFEVDGSEPKDVTFTQAGRITFMDVAGFGSELRADFSFGETYRLGAELFKPWNVLGKWFFAPHLDLSNSGFRVFNQTDPIALYRIHEESGGLDAGYAPSRFTELRAGYDVGYADAHLNLGRAGFPSFQGRLGDAHFHFRTDHTDDPVLPRAGYAADLKFHWYDAYPGADQALPVIEANLSAFHPFNSKSSLFASGDGGSTLGIRDVGLPIFFLGSPLRLSAYGTNELAGEQYYLFRGGYIRTLLALPPFVGKNLYLISAYELAKMYNFSPESKHPMDFETGVVAETALGPLFFGGSVGDSGHQKWFFQLGRVF